MMYCHCGRGKLLAKSKDCSWRCTDQIRLRWAQSSHFMNCINGTGSATLSALKADQAFRVSDKCLSEFATHQRIWQMKMDIASIHISFMEAMKSHVLH
jgi:hypothetical protein